MKKLLSLALALCLLCAALPTAASAATVVLSPQKLAVNGTEYACEKYNIDGSNYFKLRDLAKLLNGTESQFDVGWDAAAGVVSITTNHAYTTPTGEELIIKDDKSALAQVSEQTIMVDGAVRSDLTVYNIGGNNYFKLRDLGAALGFRVDYDPDTNTALVESSDYVAPTVPSGTDAGNPVAALEALRTWVDVNFNHEEYGEKSYTRSTDLGDGTHTELWITNEANGTDDVRLLFRRVYADNSVDRIILWTQKNPWPGSIMGEFCHFVIEGEPVDFGVGVPVDPATYDGSRLLDLSNASIAFSPEAPTMPVRATWLLSNLLTGVEELYRTSVAPYSLADLGFDTAKLTTNIAPYAPSQSPAPAAGAQSFWLEPGENGQPAKAIWSGYTAEKFMVAILDGDTIIANMPVNDSLTELTMTGTLIPTPERTKTYDVALYKMNPMDFQGQIIYPNEMVEQLAVLKGALEVTIAGDAVQYDIQYNTDENGAPKENWHRVTWAGGQPAGLAYRRTWLKPDGVWEGSGYGSLNPSFIVNKQNLTSGYSLILAVVTASAVEGSVWRVTITPPVVTVYNG